MKLGIIRGYDAAAFDYVKAKGLAYIEICCNFDPETEKFNSSADAINAEIARTGVPIGSVGRWNALPNVGGKIDRAVADSLKRSIDTAAAIGAPVFVLGVNEDKDVSIYRNLCLAVEYLGEMAEYAESKGVKLAVYNCDWSNFVHDSRTWEIVLDELKNVGLKYDCSHAYNRGTDYLAELHRWGDRIYHMHLKGTIRGVDDPPAGLDALDWNRIFGILYAHHYEGGISIEPHSGTWRGDLGEWGVDYTIKFARERIYGA